MTSHKIRPVEYRTVLRETVFPSKLSLVCLIVQKFQTGMNAFEITLKACMVEIKL